MKIKPTISHIFFTLCANICFYRADSHKGPGEDLNDNLLGSLGLLASYANYNLKCGAFVAMETGLIASLSLADKMKGLLDMSRNNLKMHMATEIASYRWGRGTFGIKAKPPVYRISLDTGSHLLVLNLDERRNYLEKLAQTLLQMRHLNVSIEKFLAEFSSMQANPAPEMILPPLITTAAPRTTKRGELDLHPDMALEKSEIANQVSVKVKATYSFIPSVLEYSMEFVTSKYGYYQSQEVFKRDFFVLLLDKQVKVKKFVVTTGSPNQLEMHLKTGSLFFSGKANQLAKTGKVNCMSPQHVADFNDGVATKDMDYLVLVKCLIIRIDSHHPLGIILYNVQLAS